MVRTPYFDKNGLKKGAWTREEDEMLRAYITRHGIWNWRQLPKYAGLSRCGKSCRLRWINYLQPGVKHGNYSKEEEDLITKLHQEHGNKWSLIAAKLPGRTDNEIKNHWHTRLKKCTEQDQNKSGHGQLKSTEQPREEASQTRISENRDVVMEAAESGSANSSTSPFHSTFGSNSTLHQQTMYPSEEFPGLSFIDAESGSANSSTSPFHSTFGSNSTLYQQTMYPSEEFPGLSFIDAAAEVEVPAAGTNWNDAEGSLTSFEYSSTDFWTAPFLPDNTFYNQDSCSSFSEGGPVPLNDSYFDDDVDFLYQVMQDFP